MKKAGLILALMMTLVFTGCNLQGDSVDDAEKEVGEKKPTIILKEKKELEEPIIYGLGERAVVRDDYAITILSANHTDYIAPWFGKDQRNIVVELLFENISMDENHEINNSEYGPVTGLNLYIPNMDPNPSALFHEIYGTDFTPVGTKSIQKIVLPLKNTSDILYVKYSDPLNNGLEFEVPMGERADVNLEGSIPDFEETYKMGESMVIAEAANDYTVTIDSVKKVEINRLDPEFIGGADYEVELIFSNLDLDKIGGKQFNLTMIDQYGITGYKNQFFGNPVELEDGKGVKTSVYFSAHNESEKLLLYYTDSLLDRNEGYYIEIDEIS